jgi:uncharacterized protein YjiS (DUF1127 family)
MPAQATASLLSKILDWIKARVTQDSELAAMSHTERQLLAADIGITEAELWAITPHIDDHSDLLDKMIAARGLDPDLVRHIFRGATRDMEATCARCRDVGLCQRELKAGTAAAHSHGFCGNAGVIDELLGIDI